MVNCKVNSKSKRTVCNYERDIFEIVAFSSYKCDDFLPFGNTMKPNEGILVSFLCTFLHSAINTHDIGLFAWVSCALFLVCFFVHRIHVHSSLVPVHFFAFRAQHTRYRPARMGFLCSFLRISFRAQGSCPSNPRSCALFCILRLMHTSGPLRAANPSNSKKPPLPGAVLSCSFLMI